MQAPGAVGVVLVLLAPWTLQTPEAPEATFVLFTDRTDWARLADAHPNAPAHWSPALGRGFVILAASSWHEGHPALQGDSPPAHGEGAITDPLYPSQWGLGAIQWAQAREVEEGHPGILVAVLDTGLDLTHVDFDPARVRLGFDYVGRDPLPQDEHGHGTQVAGVIAATTSNAEGIAGTANVTLYVVRVLNGANAGTCLDVALGIVESALRGAHVINLSLSCETDYLPLRLAVEFAAARGATLVAAAGNHEETWPARCRSYPASYPQVLSVGAVDEALARAKFSCRATGLDLVAPGTNVTTTTLRGYAAASGTSHSAAFVSGVAALLRAAAPVVDATTLQETLFASTLDLEGAGWDPATGFGLVQAGAALDRAADLGAGSNCGSDSFGACTGNRCPAG